MAGIYKMPITHPAIWDADPMALHLEVERRACLTNEGEAKVCPACDATTYDTVCLCGARTDLLETLEGEDLLAEIERQLRAAGGGEVFDEIRRATPEPELPGEGEGADPGKKDGEVREVVG